MGTRTPHFLLENQVYLPSPPSSTLFSRISLWGQSFIETKFLSLAFPLAELALKSAASLACSGGLCRTADESRPSDCRVCVKQLWIMSWTGLSPETRVGVQSQTVSPDI